MAKSNDGSTGILSISNSARSAGKRAAKRAANPIARGGVCSACGQQSTSCTTGTAHHGCVGYAGKPTENFDFGDPLLNLMGETYAMSADGTVIQYPITGYWISKDELLSRRAERKAEAHRAAKKRVIFTSVFVEIPGEPTDDPSAGVALIKKFSHLDVKNGLGEDIFWHATKGWITTEEADDYLVAVEVDAAAGRVEAENDAEKPIELGVAA